MNVTEGENLVLNCLTEGVPADITYSKWIHSGEFISHRELEGEEATNDYILRINKVSYRDTGRYTCQAYNRNYTEQRRSDVIVFCKWIAILDYTSFESFVSIPTLFIINIL